MLQPSPVAVPRRFERLRSEAGRRTLAIGLAILIEALMLLVFFSLSPGKPPGKAQDAAIVVQLEADEASEDQAETSQPKHQQLPQSPPVPPTPAPEPPPSPSEPPPIPAAPIVLPAPLVRAPAPAAAARPARPPGPVYGPPDTRPASAFPDSQRVGSAPNGEPLYAAAWYREPKAEMLRDYLSTASGPGWGLIACRTAPDYRVEDCVGLGEYPEGSQIMRSVLAAAWEFKVRPPRLGGQSLVGAWVRIRIDYERR